MITENKINGIIYSVKRHNFNKLRKNPNPIYIKYLPHDRSNKIKAGNYLFFYLSGEKKEIIGYSIINKIYFMPPWQIKNSIIDRIQMDEKEFNEYIKNRESRNLLILELEDIVEFEKKIKIDFHMTMTAKYLVSSEIKKIIDNNIN